MNLLAGTLRFLALLALLALATVAAAQSSNLPRIGWIISASAESTRHMVAAMHAGLADEGLTDGRNVVLDVRFLAGRIERYPEVFADLMRNPVHVLAAAGHAGISAARDASGGRIPVAAFFCGNEVTQMVETFARPGGNITGVSCLSSELAVKRVQLLKEAVPILRRIGFLYDPRSPKEKELAEVREAARGLGMSIAVATASSPEAIKDAMASLRREGAEAFIISEDVFTFGNRAIIVALAAEHRMVDISSFREFVDAGGILSYGASVSERLRMQARYAAKMIRGVKPSDLPIDQATRFEFVVNVKAARALGITIPQAVLLRADEVIR
jgi:putative tryptophan/tyrosine transport system substrate-binding protein